jgi:hypothetical protein
MLVVLCSIATGHAGELSLQIAIDLTQSTVGKDQDLPVATTIRNVGTTDQSLWIWSCSYPKHWVSDNASVRIKDVGCKKNFLSHVSLKPGEKYERVLSTHIHITDDKEHQKSLRFRLGFKPVTSKITDVVPIIWSNVASIQITE